MFPYEVISHELLKLIKPQYGIVTLLMISKLVGSVNSPSLLVPYSQKFSSFIFKCPNCLTYLK